MDLPISFVDVQTSADQPQIGLGPVSVWANVQISGDVASVQLPGTAGLAPLDTIILLDFVSDRQNSRSRCEGSSTYQTPAFPVSRGRHT